jgi:hypothetical protein
MTGKMDPPQSSHVAETARQERSQGRQPQLNDSGDPVLHQPGSPDHPEDRPGAARPSEDNDLTTGHSSPDDGGADNSNRTQ